MNDDLNQLAEDLLHRVNTGAVDFRGKFKFGGVSRETATWWFQKHIEDLESPDEAHEELLQTLPKVSAERRSALVADPECISDLELSAWVEASGAFDEIFELGYLFPLTSDVTGPCAIIGSMGDQPQPEYDIFLTAETRSDAERLWNADRLSPMMLYSPRQ